VKVQVKVKVFSENMFWVKDLLKVKAEF